MPTRATPYVFGMYIAHLHLQDKNHDYMKSQASIGYEWISFIVMWVYALIGCNPNWVNITFKNAPLCLIWALTGR